MSQLSRLIQQAKNSRRINDMFKTDELTFSPQVHPAVDGADTLESRLSALGSLLFDNIEVTVAEADDIILELEQVAQAL
ncbi:MAG: hypothetical protein H6999_09280 [Hahellaceae bacterium]|nr:hypothetical protein [Hahellaceae bacterium]MCP5169934.1 hypothetical protein [Hahellaceae bacterium]